MTLTDSCVVVQLRNQDSYDTAVLVCRELFHHRGIIHETFSQTNHFSLYKPLYQQIQNNKKYEGALGKGWKMSL